MFALSNLFSKGFYYNKAECVVLLEAYYFIQMRLKIQFADKIKICSKCLQEFKLTIRRIVADGVQSPVLQNFLGALGSIS